MHLNHFGAAEPTRMSGSSSSAPSDRQPVRKHNKACRNWNKGVCGRGKNCFYLHVCESCLKKGHTSDKCPSKGSAGGSKDTGSGADIGKIVNLMSGDASKVAQILGQVYNLYGAPFEIVVGAFFLYRLVNSTSFLSQASTDICQRVIRWSLKITRLCGIYWLHRITVNRAYQSLSLEASYIYISRYLCRP